MSAARASASSAPRSTAEARRPLVVAAATTRFAAGGWSGTTYADVAAEAGISIAYVAKLFPTKERLFVGALENCFDRILESLAAAAPDAAARPVEILDRFGDAYAHLIADRAVLMMQVHAQSAAAIPAIGEALRRGLERVTEYASRASGADSDAVQRFMAYGQLCHLVVTVGLDDVDAAWARTLAHGIRHDD